MSSSLLMHLGVRAQRALFATSRENRLSAGQVHPRSFPARVWKKEGSDGGSLRLTLRDGIEHGGFDAVINAIGRTPLSSDLGLEELGVAICKDSAAIRVDEWQQCTCQGDTSGIFALGDVSGEVKRRATERGSLFLKEGPSCKQAGSFV